MDARKLLINLLYRATSQSSELPGWSHRETKKVSANYLSDAVLLPTVSNKVRLTDAERVDYFEHFLEKKPTGKIDSRTIRTGCNKAIDSGVYTFTFADKSTVTARYTFTYAWDGKDWKISSHHSSAMPEG